MGNMQATQPLERIGPKGRDVRHGVAMGYDLKLGAKPRVSRDQRTHCAVEEVNEWLAVIHPEPVEAVITLEHLQFRRGQPEFRGGLLDRLLPVRKCDG